MLAIDRVVERLPDPFVVERRLLDVEATNSVKAPGQYDPVRMLRAEGREVLGGRGVEHHVDVPALEPVERLREFFSPNRNEIVSTNPSGCAAAGHSRNSGFLASSMNFVPVSDHVRPRRRDRVHPLILGPRVGRHRKANGIASLGSSSGSKSRGGTSPPPHRRRSSPAGRNPALGPRDHTGMQARAFDRTQEGPAPCSPRLRSIPRRKSSGRTGSPLE